MIIISREETPNFPKTLTPFWPETGAEETSELQHNVDMGQASTSYCRGQSESLETQELVQKFCGGRDEKVDVDSNMSYVIVQDAALVPSDSTRAVLPSPS